MGAFEYIKGKWHALVRGLFTIEASDILVPTDLQSRYSQIIQTHNAVSVGASGSSTGTWIDTSGFDKLKLTILNDASTASYGEIQWSNDGVNVHGVDSINSATSMYRTYEKETNARYVRIKIQNGDTVAHTMSAWAFLKV